jgi:hypothetical protein
MKVVHLKEHFDGDFLANGEEANKLRFTEIDPLFSMTEMLLFDFDGINNITDSFANALIGNLVEMHPRDFHQKLRFKNCSNGVKSAISASISLGLSRAKRLHLF